MTSSVLVRACCDEDTEVVIETTGGGDLTIPQVVLQNGQSQEIYVYDDMEVRVREAKKLEE